MLLWELLAKLDFAGLLKQVPIALLSFNDRSKHAYHTGLFCRMIDKINFILLLTVFSFIVSNGTLCKGDAQND